MNKDQEEVPKSSEEVSQTGILLENSVETVESSTLSSSELKSKFFKINSLNFQLNQSLRRAFNVLINFV